MSFNVQVKGPRDTDLDQATVTVTVLDVNDNAPVVSPGLLPVSVSEDADVGARIASFTATDADTGVNQQFQWV